MPQQIRQKCLMNKTLVNSPSLFLAGVRSMTENGDPLENAIAERVNGIIKEEYLNHYQTDNLPEAKKQLQKAIRLYNNNRPHMRIGNLTPNKLHNNKKLNHQRLWKNYFKKHNTFEKKNEIVL